MHIFDNLTTMEKLEILTDAAKYDVSCSSSGSERGNNGRGIGNTVSSGICHAFSADGRCISLLKILYSNECIYDCKYCVNRASNDVIRTSFTPEEVCNLTMEFYRRNYIEGLFLSSGIVKNPTYTMEQILATVVLLRDKYNFGGYIHIKAIPGADPSVIEAVGWYVDRMSINLELPTTEGLRMLAPNKSRKNILTPMRQIQNSITNNRRLIEDSKRRLGIPVHKNEIAMPDNNTALARVDKRIGRFAPAGQSTQMIIGATNETDYQLMTVAEALYRKYSMKRVFYSAFVNVNKDETLPGVDGSTPLAREHRLYQADFLMRFYGFQAGDLLSESRPQFNTLVDPKCDWALRHLEIFPVEINKADYYTLLKVPGIGVNSARRIIRARSSAKLTFDDLRKMGVVLKRALYFITCQGRMLYNTKLEEDYILRNIVDNRTDYRERLGGEITYKQLSFFDDNNELAIQGISEQRNMGKMLMGGNVV